MTHTARRRRTQRTQALPVREDAKKKINVVGLSERHVPSMTEFRGVLSEAHDARRTAATSANADSSRSHAILQLSLKRPSTVVQTPRGGSSSTRGAAAASACAAAIAAAGGAAVHMAYEEVGRFSFIDLAGTERGAGESPKKPLRRAQLRHSMRAWGVPAATRRMRARSPGCATERQRPHPLAPSPRARGTACYPPRPSLLL